MIFLSRIRRVARGLLCAGFLVACLILWTGENEARAGAHKKKQPPRLFGTVEFKGRIKSLPKWMRVLRQMTFWRGYFKDSSMDRLPSKTAWRKLKKNVAGKSSMEKLKAVNRFFNQWPYRLDQSNYGRRDYWATPLEFLKKSGDCEDYAIAKYYALKELGFSMDRMRIVALKDMIRNIGHAVLVVYLDDDIYVLDNQTDMVLPHTRYKHYLPQYSVNEKYRWMHVPPVIRKKKDGIDEIPRFGARKKIKPQKAFPMDNGTIDRTDNGTASAGGPDTHNQME